jgi:hypothetical protein
MPNNTFSRAGYAVFNSMLKPVLDNPESFKYDLTDAIEKYQNELLMISSECSKFGFEFQKKYHIPHMPKQTVHLEAKNMNHNMITLNPEWSLQAIGTAFSQ